MSELCACRLIDSWMSAPGKLVLQLEVNCGEQESETTTTEIAPAGGITETLPEVRTGDPGDHPGRD